jgi:pimeloyl-ACP methyl ester carboxylesterase
MVDVSTAGGLLLDILERYPQQVAASCFLSPAMQPRDAIEQSRLFELAGMVREGYRAMTINNLCEHLLSGASTTSKRALNDQILGWVKMASEHATAATMEMLPLRLGCQDEKQIYPVPTLIASGDRDKLMIVPRKEDPINNIRHIINIAGHLVNLEAPAEAYILQLTFLQTLNAIKLHHYRLKKVA